MRQSMTMHTDCCHDGSAFKPAAWRFSAWEELSTSFVSIQSLSYLSTFMTSLKADSTNGKPSTSATMTRSRIPNCKQVLPTRHATHQTSSSTSKPRAHPPPCRPIPSTPRSTNHKSSIRRSQSIRKRPPRQNPEEPSRRAHQLANGVGKWCLRVAFEVCRNCVESSADCGESCAGWEVGGLQHAFEGGDNVLQLEVGGEC
jgi:hypothetical protein